MNGIQPISDSISSIVESDVIEETSASVIDATQRMNRSTESLHALNNSLDLAIQAQRRYKEASSMSRTLMTKLMADL